jgi:hypothetical protein
MFNMSSPFRSKAIDTFEDLVKNKDIEITITDFTSYWSLLRESTDPVFVVSTILYTKVPANNTEILRPREKTGQTRHTIVGRFLCNIRSKHLLKKILK